MKERFDSGIALREWHPACLQIRFPFLPDPRRFTELAENSWSQEPLDAVFPPGIPPPQNLITTPYSDSCSRLLPLLRPPMPCLPTG